MAYVNVAEWKTDQVCEWLKGLDNTVLPYVHSFMNHGVNGQQLLGLRPEDLEHLGVLKLGHQEIILEAVEYLRNFHYELDRENLQLLALRLSCQAHSLHNELSRQSDTKPVKTQTLSDVAAVVMAVKPLVRWLDRPPFSGQLEYNDKKAELMKLSLEMATCAQRDRFAEKPIEEIRTTCGQLAKLADYIIQDIADPMILQPASLDLATLKKKPGDDLGFCILPSFHGAHQIAEIKFGSAAHQCGKMEEGDEIVQVNYQTVVGWERKNVLELFRESPAEVLLTLKRRPRHTKVYGQIYIKPYRLPSNKKTPYTTRWQHNLPSPRPELLTIPDFTMPLPRNTPKNPTPEPASILDTVNMLDTIATDSSDSDSEVEQPMSIRLYSAKPRNLVQRRATITGASPTTKHGIDIDQLWKELKQEHRTTFQLRDKAASCAHGLDNVPSNLRPQTCLGIEQTKRKKKDGQIDDKKAQEKSSDSEVRQIEETKSVDSEGDGKFIKKSQEDLTCGDKNTCDRDCQSPTDSTCNSNISDSTVPLNECNTAVGDKSNINKNLLNKEQIVRCKERGKLDKSYSTPAYDLTDSENNEDVKLVLPESCLRSNECVKIDTSTVKCDSHKTTESSEKCEISANDINKEDENVASNLNQKISNAEKNSDNKEQIRNVRVPEKLDLLKNTVHIKINDVNCTNNTKDNQSNSDMTLDINTNDKNHSTNDKTIEPEQAMKYNEIDDPSDNYSVTHESSEEKSESTSSYIEGTCSSSSDGDPTLKKFGEMLETIDSALTAHSRLIGQATNDQVPHQNLSESDSQNNVNSEIPVSSKIRKSDIRSTNSVVQGNITRPYKYKELPKYEGANKFEGRIQSTPPEPPPRRYFTKPALQEQNLSNTYQASESEEKPQVPERPLVRRDLKRVDISTDSYAKTDTDHHEKNSSFDSYANFLEKSTDYIDEPNTATNEQKTYFHSDVSIHSEYSDRQLKEERYYDRHDPVAENYSNINHSIMECYKGEQSRHLDFPDGATCSRQIQSPDYKPRTLEKDKSFEKGVVNRAMMVARSIGLHGSLGKSCNSSPRSGRKRNTLLAKKRNVSVKDVGAGELEGWLTYRSRGAGGAWAKAWFVLKCSSLYRFKTQDSIKADCLIALTGFTVSQAAEVKSRKYAFKIYHTGTVFYFAADTEDSLILWLEAVNKATLGTDAHNRNSGLFSETDESDSEYKSKTKTSHSPERKQSIDKSFGSLKKASRKDPGFKDHEISGASLDRKYLRFLGAKNQNLPVPTAQFRSYRRVLPTSTPNKKQDFMPNSPDLQMTIAGSTFYGLSASQSATDMSSTNQDMGDYRRTTDRSLRNRRPDELQGFITLEEFMLSQQDEEQRRMAMNRSVSPRTTPLNADHVHVQHRNFNDSRAYSEQIRHLIEPTSNNGMIYGQAKNDSDMSSANHGNSYRFVKDESQHVPRQLNKDFNGVSNDVKLQYINDRCCGKCKTFAHKKSCECTCTHKKKLHDTCSYPQSYGDAPQWKNHPNEHCKSFSSYHGHSTSDIQGQKKSAGMTYDQNGQMYSHGSQNSNNHGICYPGSSRDLTRHTSSETLQRAKKEVSVTRKGSFNLTNRRDHFASEKNWLDSLKRSEKKNTDTEKSRLKNVAQYQPPPIPSSPFEQEGMRAAFEMHLDKHEQVQKSSRLKNLFSTKSQQKPCTLDLPKDTQKTLLGSPRLHRALFRDKASNHPQPRPSVQSDIQSPGDSGISQSLSSFSGNSHSQTLSSASSISDWSPDTSVSSQTNISKHNQGHPSTQKSISTSNRNCGTPPVLYIPPPTSPPPDYPGLEYPPVFEPGTYSLSDASLLRNRSRNNQNNIQ